VCHASLPSSYRSRRGHIHLPWVLPLVGCRSKTPTAKAKDTRGKTTADPSSANFVQRGNPKFNNNPNKRKKPSQNPPKAKESDGPNKKKRKSGVLAILVAVRITLLRSARIVNTARLQRQQTWLLARMEEQRGMVILYLHFF
jgi:hypothetical protein